MNIFNNRKSQIILCNCKDCYFFNSESSDNDKNLIHCTVHPLGPPGSSCSDWEQSSQAKEIEQNMILCNCIECGFYLGEPHFHCGFFTFGPPGKTCQKWSKITPEELIYRHAKHNWRMQLCLPQNQKLLLQIYVLISTYVLTITATFILYTQGIFGNLLLSEFFIPFILQVETICIILASIYGLVGLILIALCLKTLQINLLLRGIKHLLTLFYLSVFLYSGVLLLGLFLS